MHERSEIIVDYAVFDFTLYTPARRSHNRDLRGFKKLTVHSGVDVSSAVSLGSRNEAEC